MWQEIEIGVDKVDVGVPEFEWLLGKCDDERIRELLGFLPDKKKTLKRLDMQYAVFLDVPVLVKDMGNGRFQMLDGYHRFVALTRKNRKTVKAQVWNSDITDKDWADRTRQLIAETVSFPQKQFLHGEAPFNLRLEGSPYYNGPVYGFMIGTGVQVPHILKNWESLGRIEARGDEFKGPWTPRLKLILGEGNHEVMLQRWGVQPLNSYLVGHFCCGPHMENALAQRVGHFVQFQQYFRGGFWGYDCPSWPYNGVSTLQEQLLQDLVGVPVLFDLGILQEDTQIYFADQSFHGNFPVEEMPIFKGKDCDYWKGDCLKEYFGWLPTYLRKYRAEDFNVPIEEVLKCYPIEAR